MRNLNWPQEELEMFSLHIAQIDSHIYRRQGWQLGSNRNMPAPAPRLHVHNYSQL